MLRTILTLGAVALLGLFALKLLFGVGAAFFGLFFWLFFIAVRIAIVGALVYLAIRLLSPGTARRLRQKWSGRPSY
jgi:ABC-type multidrug transport system permease subunit